MLVGMLSLGVYYMVLAFVVVNLAWLFVWHYFVAKQIRIRLVDVFKDIMPFLLLSLISLCICFISTLFLAVNNIYMLFMLKLLIVSALYIAMLYFSGAVIFKEVLSFLRKRQVSRL